MPSTSAISDPGRCRVLITSGPTHEAIDAVRYLANRSSGRMGIALAEAAANRGMPTTLLLGPTHLQWPQSAGSLPNSSQTRLVRFQSTADLQRLIEEHWPNPEVLIMAAAVADSRPATDSERPAGKLRRTGEKLTLTLEPTPDLLAALARHTRPDQTVIGFALEPDEQLIESAIEKLSRKQLDAIVANSLETMDAQDVTATVLLRDGSILEAPRSIPKVAFATWLLDHLPTSRALPRNTR